MEWYESTEDMRLKLRKKYAEGLVSDYYMQTGIPQIFSERVKKAEGDISSKRKTLAKQQKKSQDKAIKAYKKAHGNCKEYRMIFV